MIRLCRLSAIFSVLWASPQAKGDFQLGDSVRGVLDDVSDFVSARLGPDQVGASYAALINFAGNPDISTATYYIDSVQGAEATLNVGRFSFRHSFFEEGDEWRPFIQGLIPYEQLRYDLDVGEKSDVADAHWNGVGLVLTAGNEFIISDRWKIVPAINFGSFRLDSNAGFRGAASESIFDPTFTGPDFDWTAYAWVLGASVAFDYEREFRGFDLGFHTGITFNHVKSFYTSSKEIRFSSDALTLVANLETVHQTPVNINGFPLSVVFSVGGTALLGPARDALGFSGYTDYGVAVRTDISRLGLPLKTLQLGGKFIYGPDVIGWSGIFNYNF